MRHAGTVFSLALILAVALAGCGEAPTPEPTEPGAEDAPREYLLRVSGMT